MMAGREDFQVTEEKLLETHINKTVQREYLQII
jgi:hypothetical protein